MPTPFRSRTLLVSAGVLVSKENGAVLLAQRPEGKPLAGYWEFPGGKVEPTESPEAALIRELNEEIGITVSPNNLEPFTFVSEDCSTFHLLMPIYIIRHWEGEPVGREKQTLRWAPLDTLHSYSMPKPDLPLIPKLQQYLKG
ncbi:NUDIX domain-containing protein [Saccharibacter sp. 17.LH.SD]|uniref:(deoxy)nucleoside triphosphate pyrophosphohydrolase n=1 Tax=Saccharibacter sp. 17.LH.SD TaxID=2689393 RepID=UPI00136DA860|nr:(deoxy)nucleoside triphosphate pyrophosphohydrolase [Saccharibacter sp. 17.LH.SD]MXV44075.1 NUDIX domain-containing protein [Saccharibacter sp. 17.LH.SD]